MNPGKGQLKMRKCWYKWEEINEDRRNSDQNTLYLCMNLIKSKIIHEKGKRVNIKSNGEMKNYDSMILY